MDERTIFSVRMSSWLREAIREVATAMDVSSSDYVKMIAVRDLKERGIELRRERV